MMKKDVGLIILTKLPDLGEVAVLQIRGEFNYETKSPESYPGGSQVTVHGGIEEGESEEKALRREIEEELGEEVADILKSKKFIEISRKESEERSVTTYGVFLEPEFLEKVKLHPSSGGLRFLKKEDLDKVVSLKDSDRKEGVGDKRITAMFPDEIKDLSLAFEKLNSS